MGIFSRNNNLVYTTPPTKKRGRLFIAIFGLSLAIVAIFLILQSGSSNNTGAGSPVQKFANTFVSYIVSGDTKASYAMVSIATKRNVSQDNWNGKLAKLNGYYKSAVYKGTQVVIAKTPSGSGESNLAYQAVGNDGGKYIFRIGITQAANGDFGVISFTASQGTYDAKK